MDVSKNVLPTMRQQVTRVFGAIMLFIGVACGLEIQWIETRHLIREKESQYEQVLVLLRSAAEDAIIAEDTNLLRDLLDDIGKDDQNIVRIEITNDENKTLARMTRGTDAADRADLISREISVIAGDANQGKVQMDINLRSARKQISNHVLIFVSQLFLMLMGLLLVLLWLVSRTTLRPIVAVEERLKELGEGTLRSDFEEGGSREMAQLARSLNSVAETLSSQLTQAEEQAARLRSENVQRVEAQVTAEQKNIELQSALVQLREAQEALVKKERMQALGQMAGGMAHDFNNTLTPIIAGSDLLREFRVLDDSQIDEFVEMIRTAAGDAAELVREIRRNYTQTSSTSLQSNKLSSVVSSAIHLAESEMLTGRRRHMSGSIRILQDVDSALQIWGSQSLLRQAVVNLIINAVDAMPDGGTIRVTGTRHEDKIALDVTDSGVGMSPDLVEKCMSPLFTTKGDLGTGLGLTNVATVTSELGGTVEIESVLNTGTTVRLLLPSMDSLVSTDEKTQEVVYDVLVVDDEPAVRRGVVRLLERLGHRATGVETPFAALDMIPEQKPDLLLTDFRMPDMNGGELAAKAVEIDPELVVILMTAFRDAVASSPNAAERTQFIIDKPVGLNSLKHAIASIEVRRIGQ
ncbi:MAG: ATP-binding protein, partial [Planctomycetaceae bacterium]